MILSLARDALHLASMSKSAACRTIHRKIRLQNYERPGSFGKVAYARSRTDRGGFSRFDFSQIIGFRGVKVKKKMPACGGTLYLS
jgi:hypothetical protein